MDELDEGESEVDATVGGCGGSYEWRHVCHVAFSSFSVYTVDERVSEYIVPKKPTQ
jgi:hypothetical protein